MTEPRRRYPGTGPFGPEDAALFFGRKRETEELYLRILSVPLMLQFGKSGLGKTSLLQAGLFPLLRAKPFLPVMIRLNDPNESLTAAVARSIRESIVDEGVDISDESPAGLWELLASTTAWRQDLLLTPVLVFDQFEEVFTLRDQAFRDGLAMELGALATGIPPERLGEARIDRPDVKLLISLKETHLGALEQFSANIPGLFQERLRLEPLSEADARDAVLKPAQLEARKGETPYWTKPFTYDASTLDNMLTYLKGRSDVIEPFQLQLLSRHAEGIAFRKQSAPSAPATPATPVTLTMEDFKGSKAFAVVLSNFYRDVLSHISSPVERKRAAVLCENGLLGSAGQRLMLEKKQILGDYRVSENTLDVLSRERLIREVRRMESTFYELNHDRLADSVFAARSKRLPKAFKRMVWTVAMAVVVSAILLVGIGLVAWNRTVEQERDDAENLLSFLLGEQFLGEVRDIGQSTLLLQVQQQVDRHSGDMRSALTRGLAFRNRGEIERTKGRLVEAVQRYRQALASFQEARNDPDALREIGRTHDSLGNALASQGKLTTAMPIIDDADVIWRKVANTPGNPNVVRGDCMSMAESALFTAEMRMRMGESKRALAALDNVFTIVSEIIFDREQAPPRCGIMAEEAAPYPEASAVRVLSNAALIRGILLSSAEDHEGAATLAAEARKLQPASLAARRNALVTLAWRGKVRGLASPADALRDYRTALQEFEELRRSDPANSEWKRERATSELRVSEGIVACHQQPGACNPLPALDDAEEMMLESKAALTELASIDATNHSLRDDLAWAEQVDFAIQSARRRPGPERLAAIRNVRRIHDQTGRDPADTDHDNTTIALLGQEIDVLIELGQFAEAQQAQRRAIELATKLVTDHPDDALYYETLAAVRARGATLRRATGDVRDIAFAARKEAEARQAHDRLTQEQSEAAAELAVRAEWYLANGSTRSLDDSARAAREFATAVSVFREALRRRPASYRTYERLGAAYQQLQLRYKKLGDREARMDALSASMHASQIAAWLAPADQRTEANRILLQARNDFAQTLIDEDKPESYESALGLLQESVVVAESLVQREPSNADYVWSLGNAKCSLGAVRRSLASPGWEGAIRSGLIDVKKAVALQPNNRFYRENHAFQRKRLGDLLAQDAQNERAAAEYAIALEEYETVARTNPASSAEIGKEIAALRAKIGQQR